MAKPLNVQQSEQLSLGNIWNKLKVIAYRSLDTVDNAAYIIHNSSQVAADSNEEWATRMLSEQKAKTQASLNAIAAQPVQQSEAA